MRKAQTERLFGWHISATPRQYNNKGHRPRTI